MIYRNNGAIPGIFITNGIIDFRSPESYVQINDTTTLLITVEIHVGAEILLAISNVSQHSKRRKISRDFGGNFG